MKHNYYILLIATFFTSVAQSASLYNPSFNTSNSNNNHDNFNNSGVIVYNSEKVYHDFCNCAPALKKILNDTNSNNLIKNPGKNDILSPKNLIVKFIEELWSKGKRIKVNQKEHQMDSSMIYLVPLGLRVKHSESMGIYLQYEVQNGKATYRNIGTLNTFGLPSNKNWESACSNLLQEEPKRDFKKSARIYSYCNKGLSYIKLKGKRKNSKKNPILTICIDDEILYGTKKHDTKKIYKETEVVPCWGNEATQDQRYTPNFMIYANSLHMNNNTIGAILCKFKEKRKKYSNNRNVEYITLQSIEIKKQSEADSLACEFEQAKKIYEIRQSLKRTFSKNMLECFNRPIVSFDSNSNEQSIKRNDNPYVGGNNYYNNNNNIVMHPQHSQQGSSYQQGNIISPPAFNHVSYHNSGHQRRFLNNNKNNYRKKDYNLPHNNNNTVIHPQYAQQGSRYQQRNIISPPAFNHVSYHNFGHQRRFLNKNKNNCRKKDYNLTHNNNNNNNSNVNPVSVTPTQNNIPTMHSMGNISTSTQLSLNNSSAPNSVLSVSNSSVNSNISYQSFLDHPNDIDNISDFMPSNSNISIVPDNSNLSIFNNNEWNYYLANNELNHSVNNNNSNSNPNSQQILNNQFSNNLYVSNDNQQMSYSQLHYNNNNNSNYNNNNNNNNNNTN